MPGMAASTSETCEFGSPPKAVEAPENNFACEVTCACTSMPMTTSQSPVAPLISFDFFCAGASILTPDCTRFGLGYALRLLTSVTCLLGPPQVPAQSVGGAESRARRGTGMPCNVFALDNARAPGLVSPAINLMTSPGRIP